MNKFYLLGTILCFAIRTKCQLAIPNHQSIDSVIMNLKKNNEYIIHFGTNITAISSAEIASGHSLGVLGIGHGNSTIKFKVTNNKLLVSIKVINEKQEILAEIEDNNWVISKDILIKNNDKTAFEVIDKYNHVALNIREVDKEIFVNGIFRGKNRMFVASDSQLSIFENEEESSDRFQKAVASIKKIFVYDGSYGKRAKK